MKELLKQWKKIEFGTCLWLLRSLRVIDLVFTFGQTSIIKSMPINKIQHSLFISFPWAFKIHQGGWDEKFLIPPSVYIKLEKWEAGNWYVRKFELQKIET